MISNHHFYVPGKTNFLFLCVDCDDLIFYCHYSVRKKEKIAMKLKLKFNVLCINANFFQLKPNHVYPKGESASYDLEFPTKKPKFIGEYFLTLI